MVQRDTRVWIPADLDFAAVPGLSNEMAERLGAARPETLDQASRVPGVTPAALSALYVAASAGPRRDRRAWRGPLAGLFHVKHSISSRPTSHCCGRRTSIRI